MGTRAQGDPEKRTGTDQYASFMKRLLKSYGRKAAAGELDTTALAQLVELRDLLDQQTADVVVALRGGTHPHSWAQIGDALGITRAAAFKRYGSLDPESARLPGGQPAHLR